MKAKQFLFVGSVILCGAFAHESIAAEKTKAKHSILEEEAVVEGVGCNLAQDMRRLEVHTRAAGCTLQYLKLGRVTQIAAANHGVEVCKDRLKKVRSTLEGSGYLCD